MEQLVAALEDATKQIETKKIEAEAKKEIVLIQEETKRLIASAQIDAADGLALLKAEIAQIQSELGAARATEAQERQQAHEAAQADMARQAQAQQQAQQPQPAA